MTSFAPPECVMNGTTESHNDHILNRRWHRESARLSLLSVIWVLDYIQGGRRAKRYDGRNADLDELLWLSNPRAQKNAAPPGWLWTSKNNSIHSSVQVFFLKGTYYAKITFACCLNINVCWLCVHNHPIMIKIHLLLFLIPINHKQCKM